MKAMTWARINYVLSGANLGVALRNIEYKDVGWKTAIYLFFGIALFLIGRWQEEQARLGE